MLKIKHYALIVTTKKLEKIMNSAFEAVWRAKEKYGVDMRVAAFIVALERISEAMKGRG